MRICLVLEGCYPYVHGGVSTWMHGYIQAMPGHASPTATQIYAQVSIRALKAIHTVTHPGSRSGRAVMMRWNWHQPPTSARCWRRWTRKHARKMRAIHHENNEAP